MNTDDVRSELDRITGTVIGCAQRVSNELGSGFLEKVYENALCVELKKAGLAFEAQPSLQVRYQEEIVGNYVADIVVGGKAIVEVKALTALEATHRAQCMNYLKATGMTVCLLINFGRPRIEVKRIVRNY